MHDALFWVLESVKKKYWNKNIGVEGVEYRIQASANALFCAIVILDGKLDSKCHYALF